MRADRWPGLPLLVHDLTVDFTHLIIGPDGYNVGRSDGINFPVVPMSPARHPRGEQVLFGAIAVRFPQV